MISVYPSIPRTFWLALIGNMIWINLSEVVRYFALIRPMLHESFPDQPEIAAITPALFASWMIWDTILILAATGFYWMYLERFGATSRHAGISSAFFTVTVFGLLWLGVANMGLVPLKFAWVALPFAWAEQFIAALIVIWVLRRESREKARRLKDQPPAR